MLAHGTSLWKTIRKEWPLISRNADFCLGNGSRIRFWTDSSVMGFPSLRILVTYNIAQRKKVFVADYWVFGEEQVGWKLEFTRNLNDWDKQPLLKFLGRIEKSSLDAD